MWATRVGWLKWRSMSQKFDNKYNKGMKKANRKITMNDLAVMVKNGFDETGEKIEGIEKGLKKEIKSIGETNAREHEAIMLRLDNVAYRFELVELQKRVDVLEKKVGVRHK